MAESKRALTWMLRVIGTLDLSSIIFVFAPRESIAMTHRWLGMGEFPNDPIAGYLARTTSIWFAIYGLLLWYVSSDVHKYASLIRFLSAILLIQGFVIAAIDWTEGLPTWWIGMEGLVCSGMGLSLLVLQRDNASNESA